MMRRGDEGSSEPGMGALQATHKGKYIFFYLNGEREASIVNLFDRI